MTLILAVVTLIAVTFQTFNQTGNHTEDGGLAEGELDHAGDENHHLPTMFHDGPVGGHHQGDSLCNNKERERIHEIICNIFCLLF